MTCKKQTVMDSDNDSHHSENEFYFPDEENVFQENKNKNGCSENSTQKLLSKYSTEEKK